MIGSHCSNIRRTNRILSASGLVWLGAWLLWTPGRDRQQWAANPMPRREQADRQEQADRRVQAGRQGQADPPELVEWAVLEPGHSRPGPPSGHFIRKADERVPLFQNQPVQGFSSVLSIGPRRFLVLSDNGFGARENSADYVLALHDIEVLEGEDATAPGRLVVLGTIELSDPDRKLPFPIVADADRYPHSEIPVDPEIRRRTLLTGADLDVESLQRLPDETYWLGDEFGPFLVHVDASGRVLDVPVGLDGVASPQDPLGRPPTLFHSSGFEGMSMTGDGRHLLPMLEKPIRGASDGRSLIAAFDPGAKRFTGKRWHYRLDPAATAIGDFAPVEGGLHLVVERDEGQGPTAQHKKVYLVDLEASGPDGSVRKVELLDLLAIPDPSDLNGDGEDVFRFPFQTIEAIALVDPRTLVILNDNNYPFGRGRPESARPDANEFIRVRFPHPIREYAPGASP